MSEATLLEKLVKMGLPLDAAYTEGQFQYVIDAALRRAKAEVLEAAAKHFRGEIMDPDGKEYLEGYNSALRHVAAWLELDADARAAQIEEGTHDKA